MKACYGSTGISVLNHAQTVDVQCRTVSYTFKIKYKDVTYLCLNKPCSVPVLTYFLHTSLPVSECIAAETSTPEQEDKFFVIIVYTKLLGTARIMPLCQIT